MREKKKKNKHTSKIVNNALKKNNGQVKTDKEQGRNFFISQCTVHMAVTFIKLTVFRLWKGCNKKKKKKQTSII